MTRLVSILSFLLLSFQVSASIPEDHAVFKDFKRGISLHSPVSNWTFSEPSSEKLLLVARGPKNPQEDSAPILTLRADSSQRFKTVKSYSDHWLREYPKYGFQVDFARPNTIAGIKGYELQVRSLDVKKAVHQTVLPQENEMLIFTCTAEMKSFSRVVKDCKKIISSLRLDSGFDGGLSTK